MFTLATTWTVRSPWCIPGTSAPGPDVDIQLARDHAGGLILPGTAVKGLVRGAAFSRRADLADGLKLPDIDVLIAEAFGGESLADAMGQGSNDPRRGLVDFDDLKLAEGFQESATAARTVRVEIDPKTGTAMEGHLLFVECPFPLGLPVEFTGTIRLRFADKRRAETFARLIQAAASWIPAIGGMRSSGFGTVSGISFDPLKAATPAQMTVPSTRLRVVYQVDRPFLVDTSRSGSNLIEGSDVIPGSAIKGVLAEALRLDGPKGWDAALPRLRISHAHPAAMGSAGMGRRPFPLSLAASTKKDRVTLFSMLGCTTEHLINHPAVLGSDNPIAFDSDMKDRASLLAGLSNCTELLFDYAPGKIARTRTAISEQTGTSEDKMLFSEVAVNPEGTDWIGTIEQPGDTPNEVMERICKLLNEGVAGLGKSRAILFGVVEKLQSERQTVEEGVPVVLTLLTDAQMVAAEEARSGLFLGYQRFFDKFQVDLADWDCMTRERLVGRYTAMRYPSQPEEYEPWVLTCAGSEFRVTPRNKDGVAALEDMLAQGMPPASQNAGDWQIYPFARESGYGACAANLIDHAQFSKGVTLERKDPSE